VIAAKAVLGTIPFAGSLLAELAGAVIPNQRIDRIARFALELEARLGDVEQSMARAALTNEEFTDLVEEGLRQSVRSTTDERRQQIASAIANSLASEDISFIESKHLLRMLGEINDLEVIWLRSYAVREIGGDAAFRAKHQHVLAPVSAHLGSGQPEVDRETIQDSYKEHLRQLGLLRAVYKFDRKTGMPEFDAQRGELKVAGYDLTRAGRLLLRLVGLIET
jgi:hypothetical protein